MSKIKRHRSSRGFTTVNNDYLDDKNLSWKGKGLISYLMRLPDDWNINVEDLKNRSKDGRDGTSSGMKELEENKYCIKKRLRDKDGKMSGIEYLVSDIKIVEKPITENPIMEKPITENPELLNTNKPNTILPNTLFNEERESSFELSSINDIDLFKKQLVDVEKLGINVEYYYNAVKTWSSKNIESSEKPIERTAKGWILTARTFMRNDKKFKKLEMMKEPDNSQEFLNM